MGRYILLKTIYILINPVVQIFDNNKKAQKNFKK